MRESPDKVHLTCNISRAIRDAIAERCRRTGETTGHVVRAALSEYLQVDHSTLFQVSTTGALVEGLYHGEVTVGELKSHGDFGLGTFDGLDGEMVAIDGRYFQVTADGKVSEVDDSVRSPYAMVTRFVPASAICLRDAENLDDLYSQLDELRDSQNVFYAIRVDGIFDLMHTRSVQPMDEGVPLVEAASHQREFDLHGVQGTLVGFWSPGYLKTVLVSGYHLHFLAADRLSGGHLLGCAGRQLTVSMQREADFRVSLPESKSFLRADLTKDPSHDLEIAEKVSAKGDY